MVGEVEAVVEAGAVEVVMEGEEEEEEEEEEGGDAALDDWP